MLILTRKPGEKVRIGDDIIIHVVEIGKGNVRIGVEAPKDVSIMRDEVVERIEEENLQAAKRNRNTLVHAASLLKNKTMMKSGDVPTGKPAARRRRVVTPKQPLKGDSNKE
ncbi:carbon storage regulator CsrA [Desulfoluna butyratoxydans]|uniref:Translational regulator CsrA n=1 Tax=Desulfoluna butyratoxydans TaxID=231438 RepID=A0A4U8YQ52_9BACT|nr:carbon storage regulator CsrA [Desulfoluna butyratoxydans]VFQ46366.1 carbon storage regulator [Desulfoluna butyratoxydans]